MYFKFDLHQEVKASYGSKIVPTTIVMRTYQENKYGSFVAYTVSLFEDSTTGWIVPEHELVEFQQQELS